MLGVSILFVIITIIAEEKIEKQFDEAVNAINLAQKHINYIKQGLKECMKDKKEFSEEMKENLQAEYKRIENRLDKLLVGYCDGTISAQLYNEKSIEWNKNLEDINIKLDAFIITNQKYYDEGVKIIETLKMRTGFINCSLFRKREKC